MSSSSSESAEAVLVCVTRLSNPAPVISWTLGDHIISGDLYTQTDSPEPLEPHKVTSSSELRYTFSREQEGQQVKLEI